MGQTVSELRNSFPDLLAGRAAELWHDDSEEKMAVSELTTKLTAFSCDSVVPRAEPQAAVHSAPCTILPRTDKATRE